MRRRTRLHRVLCALHVAVGLGFIIGTARAWGGESFSGRVVGLADGDTISVMRDGRSVSVRLDAIDAPERGQAFGSRARAELSVLVFEKVVRVEVRDLDRYGRLVGRVFVDNIDASQYMVNAGMAWHFTRYSDDELLAEAERRARNERRGLWDDPTAIAPWDWRHPGQSRPAPTFQPGVVEGCAKRFCREMTSCTDARHHLEVCGVTSLEGDSDGVPCETLCR